MSCLPIYLNDMRALAEKVPEVHEAFLGGKFTIHRTHENFNGVWSDLALEQTFNKEGKTSLLKGITHNPTATDKYIKSAPYMANVFENAKAMVHFDPCGSGHHGDTNRAAEEERNLVGTMRQYCQQNDKSISK